MNLRAPLLLTQAAIPAAPGQRRRRIVNIGSVNAYIGEPKLCRLFGLEGRADDAHEELRVVRLNSYRIRVNQINVGWTLTEGEDKVKKLEGKGDNWLDDAMRTRPWGRLLLPADVANAVVYFASGRQRARDRRGDGSGTVSGGRAAQFW